MKCSFFRRMWRSLGCMPDPAYIFLCAVLNIALIMLFSSFIMLLIYLEGNQQNMQLFNLAFSLAKDPAGVLAVGVIGLALILDLTI